MTKNGKQGHIIRSVRSVWSIVCDIDQADHIYNVPSHYYREELYI